MNRHKSGAVPIRLYTLIVRIADCHGLRDYTDSKIRYRPCYLWEGHPCPGYVSTIPFCLNRILARIIGILTQDKPSRGRTFRIASLTLDISH